MLGRAGPPGSEGRRFGDVCQKPRLAGQVSERDGTERGREKPSTIRQ